MRICCRILCILFAAHAMRLAAAEITVQVCNTANAPRAEVRRALAGADWILRQAGIEAHWDECDISVREQTGDPARRQHSGSKPFVVSILPQDPRVGHSADVLGFAVLAGGWNGAAVIYPRVVSMIKDNPDYADCNILGSVIAHELGHLLLRSPQHGEGIMKANWDARDFEAMKQKRLRFSPALARQLKASVPKDRKAVALSADRTKWQRIAVTIARIVPLSAGTDEPTTDFHPAQGQAARPGRVLSCFAPAWNSAPIPDFRAEPFPDSAILSFDRRSDGERRRPS